MSRSAIFTANQNEQSVSDGGAINLGNTVRRFGPNIRLQGNAIEIIGAGYYEAEVSITCAPTAIGTVTATLQQDGIPVVGAQASAQVASANTIVNLSFPAIVRENYYGASNLTIVLSGTAATVSNIAVKVVKS